MNVTTTPFRTLSTIILLWASASLSPGQVPARIDFNAQRLFLSGTNIAWVNFAGDLGPGSLDTNAFRAVFDSIHTHGGNSLRLWLHTNGTQTPEFDANGKVTGPGIRAAEYLHRLLDMAWQRKVGLVLCLWSFDMERASIGSLYTSRNALMLNDTSYTHAYIDNGLVPLVNAVKGHPAIIAWEVFNEAEGMTNEFGWTDIYHVPIASIQRFVNLVAGAIHRADPAAQVTTGAWALTVQTDFNGPAAAVSSSLQPGALTEQQRQHVEAAFTARYGIHMSAEDILARLTGPNYNYYRDDRLIAAGGDPLGMLDFYTVHYYDWQGTSISPFHHPSSTWNLTKPLVIGEFFPEQTLTLPFTVLYDTLYSNGYAGAMSWGWYSGASGHSQDTLKAHTLVLTQDLYSRYPGDIQVDASPGTIYWFTVRPAIVDSGESSILDWSVAAGSNALLNGQSVGIRELRTVRPDSTTSYTLVTAGAVAETSTVTLSVYPAGTIIAFAAAERTIGTGDLVQLRWKAAHGSTVTLNDSLVQRNDSLLVRPLLTTQYTLISSGSVRDTAHVTVVVVPANEFNRALNKPVTVSASSANASYSNPQNIVDGDTLTQWMSYSANNQWVVCDLGSLSPIQQIVVNWGWNYATSFRIETGVDGVSWDTVRTVTGGNGGIFVVDSLRREARYVRIWLSSRYSVIGGGFVLRELGVYGDQTQVSAGESRNGIPERFALSQNYPNPFNPGTNIAYTVDSRQVTVDSKVKLAVYDLLGREVATLVNEKQAPGRYTVRFDGSRLATGVYLYRLQAGGYMETKRMLLLK